MTNEITTTAPTAMPVYAPQPQEESFLLQLNQQILSGDITVERMNQLLDIKKRIADQRALDAFNIAMAEMQPEIPIIGKDKATDKSKYASYEAIMEEVAPIMGAHGFSLSFKMEQTESKVLIHGKLSHRAGHSESVVIPLPLDTSGSKNAVQSMGSTLSYGKRYAASMLLNIATKEEDDDGAGGGVRKEYINQIQINTLEDWIVKLGEVSRGGLLKLINVKAVSEIETKDYQKALTALTDKARSVGVK